MTSGSPALGTSLVPGYEILRLLGKGAMEEVFLVHLLRLGRAVSIKSLPPERSVEINVQVARFRREAGLMERISPPNILAIDDSGECDDRPFLVVMEYVDPGGPESGDRWAVRSGSWDTIEHESQWRSSARSHKVFPSFTVGSRVCHDESGGPSRQDSDASGAAPTP